MRKESNTGGKPHTIGQCTTCGEVYPVRETKQKELQPIGTDGVCDNCGNNQFQPVLDP